MNGNNYYLLNLLTPLFVLVSFADIGAQNLTSAAHTPHNAVNSRSEHCVELETEADGAVLCSYDEVLLTATPGYDNYRWYYNFSDNNTDGNLFIEGPSNELLLNAGEWAVSYWYVQVDSPTCEEPSETVWWDSWVFAFPAIAHDANTQLCPGDSALISSAFQGPAFFQWFVDFQAIDGATSSTYWVQSPGFYTLSVAYGECPELWISSGVGPEFSFYGITPLALSITMEGEGATLSLNYGDNVTWYFNGEVLEGIEGTEISVTEQGTYAATATDSNGCLVSSNEVEVVLMSTRDTRAEGPSAFPNPFSDQFTIDTGGLQVVYMRMYDLTGKEVYAREKRFDARADIKLPHFEKGLYFLELTAAGGERHTLKLVKR